MQRKYIALSLLLISMMAAGGALQAAETGLTANIGAASSRWMSGTSYVAGTVPGGACTAPDDTAGIWNVQGWCCSMDTRFTPVSEEWTRPYSSYFKKSGRFFVIKPLREGGQSNQLLDFGNDFENSQVSSVCRFSNTTGIFNFFDLESYGLCAQREEFWEDLKSWENIKLFTEYGGLGCRSQKNNNYGILDNQGLCWTQTTVYGKCADTDTVNQDQGHREISGADPVYRDKSVYSFLYANIVNLNKVSCITAARKDSSYTVPSNAGLRCFAYDSARDMLLAGYVGCDEKTCFIANSDQCSAPVFGMADTGLSQCVLPGQQKKDSFKDLKLNLTHGSLDISFAEHVLSDDTGLIKYVLFGAVISASTALFLKLISIHFDSEQPSGTQLDV